MPLTDDDLDKEPFYRRKLLLCYLMRQGYRYVGLYYKVKYESSIYDGKVHIGSLYPGEIQTLEYACGLMGFKYSTTIRKPTYAVVHV